MRSSKAVVDSIIYTYHYQVTTEILRKLLDDYNMYNLYTHQTGLGPTHNS